MHKIQILYERLSISISKNLKLTTTNDTIMYPVKNEIKCACFFFKFFSSKKTQKRRNNCYVQMSFKEEAKEAKRTQCSRAKVEKGGQEEGETHAHLKCSND